MSQSLTLTHSLLQKYLPVTGMNQMFVLFELNGKGEISQRAPINLSVVLDRSSSMKGKPIHYCKEATKFIVQQLQENDLINVVVFDDQVQTVLPPQEVRHKDLLNKKIDQLATGGMTNLSGELIKGCQNLLSQNTDQFVNRIILLSDGHANRGMTNYPSLMKVVDDYQTSGAIISTMGVSEHFNEELMEGIANHGNGNYYFINEVDQIPDIFAQELEGILSIVAQNVHFNLTPKNGIQVNNIFGYRPKIREKSHSIPLGDMYANEIKSILVEVSIPPLSEGIHDLFDLEWSFVDVTSGVKDCIFRLNLPAEFTMDPTKLSEGWNGNVEKQVEITRSSLIIEQAMSLFDKGQFESGKQILYKQAEIMAEKAKILNDEELLEESQVLYKQLKDFQYSRQKRKELHQEKYRQLKRKKQEYIVLDKIEQLTRYVKESNYTVIFTGAGMSTEGDLLDFRSASSGLWNNMNPANLATTDAMKYNRKQFIDFYRYRVESIRQCQPHSGHYILAEWEKQGIIQSIISQNVDGYHHYAGSKKVEELHGTLRTCHCNDCGKRYPIERFMGDNLFCECGGFIRPSVVLFGESLPTEALISSEQEVDKAELFIVMGSSLSVSPANLFPKEAKRNGAKLVIINMDKTGLDHEADMVINDKKIGRVLQQVNQLIF